MKLTYFHVQGIGNIDDLEFRPGAVTEITGRNASGKTSVFNAFRAIVGNRKDPSIIQRGTYEAIVEAIAEDGTRITKIFPGSDNPDGKASTVVEFADGTKKKNAQPWISKTLDMAAIDPALFVLAGKKEQAELLMETISPDIRKEDIEFAVNPTKEDAIALPAELFGEIITFDTVDEVRQHVYDQRHDLNVAKRVKEEHLEELRKTLPPDLGPSRLEEVRGELASVNAEIAETKSQLVLGQEKELSRLKLKHEQAVNEINSTTTQQITKTETKATKDIQDVRDEAARRIKEIEDWRDTTVSGLEGDRDTTVALAKTEQAGALEKENKAYGEIVESLGRTHKNALDELNSKNAEKVNTLTAEMTREEEAQKEFERGRDTRLTIINYEVAAEELDRRSTVYSEALKRIDGFKEQLLESLPIPNLVVRQGEVFYEKIPYERLNTAKKFEVAVKVSALRAGEYGFICADNCESLDSESRRELIRQCQLNGLQLIMASVSEGDLKVETKNYEQALAV